jgi:hypothetical protein
MFNALTPRDQEPQTGPNFCPFCGYWHPAASMVTGHVGKEHRNMIAYAGPALLNNLSAQERAEARAVKMARIKARKAARDRARKDTA